MKNKYKSKIFDTSPVLASSILEKANNSEEEEEDNVSFVCERCSNSYESKEALDIHEEICSLVYEPKPKKFESNINRNNERYNEEDEDDDEEGEEDNLSEDSDNYNDNFDEDDLENGLEDEYDNIKSI